MTEERIIRVEGGCLDCPNRYADTGTGYTEHRKDGSIKDVYCLADQPQERECISDEFPDWCPLESLEEHIKSKW